MNPQKLSPMLDQICAAMSKMARRSTGKFMIYSKGKNKFSGGKLKISKNPKERLKIQNLMLLCILVIFRKWAMLFFVLRTGNNTSPKRYSS